MKWLRSPLAARGPSGSWRVQGPRSPGRPPGRGGARGQRPPGLASLSGLVRVALLLTISRAGAPVRQGVWRVGWEAITGAAWGERGGAMRKGIAPYGMGSGATPQRVEGGALAFLRYRMKRLRSPLAARGPPGRWRVQGTRSPGRGCRGTTSPWAWLLVRLGGHGIAADDFARPCVLGVVVVAGRGWVGWGAIAGAGLGGAGWCNAEGHCTLRWGVWAVCGL